MTETFKGTPGDWRVRRGGELMPDDERLIVADLGLNPGGIMQIRTIARTFENAGREQALANADMLAAAPALFRVAQILASLESDDGGRRFPTKEEIATARAAIRQALGTE